MKARRNDHDEFRRFPPQVLIDGIAPTRAPSKLGVMYRDEYSEAKDVREEMGRRDLQRSVGGEHELYASRVHHIVLC